MDYTCPGTSLHDESEDLKVILSRSTSFVVKDEDGAQGQHPALAEYTR